MAENKHRINDKVRPSKRIGLIELLLCLIIIGDFIVFWWATDRPQGLAPSDPKNRPNLVVTPTEADSGSSGLLSDGKKVLFPAMTLELTRSSGSSKYEVRGFGRREGALYLIVRLHESMDFSLRKGWGKTFQLTDNTGKKYLYNSVSLPNAVEIHDTFVDLPNDIRARQTVLAGGYRDLVLIFPEFSKDATPVSLLVIEDFLGNSPANPGITYEEARIEKTGEVREIRPVMAMSPGKKSYQGSGTAGDGTTFKLKQVIIDQSVQWQISLEVSAHRQTVITLNDAVLVDEGGANYNLVQKDEVQTVNLKENGTEILNLSFEPLPATVEKMVLWLQYTTAAGMPNEVRFEISQAG